MKGTNASIGMCAAMLAMVLGCVAFGAKSWREDRLSGSTTRVLGTKPEKFPYLQAEDVAIAYHEIARTKRRARADRNHPPTEEELAGFETNLAFLEGELTRRELVKPGEWETIRVRKIQIGMSEASLLASWGRAEDVNKTIGSFGVHKQHVYSRGRKIGDEQYVYTENGIVTTIQTD